MCSSDLNGTFSVGNTVKGRTSGAVGTILSIPSTNQIRVSNTYFRKTEVVDEYSGSNYLRISGTVSAVANNTGIMTYYDESGSSVYMELNESTGGFKVNDQIVDITNGSMYSATISRIDNFNYSATSFEP